MSENVVEAIGVDKYFGAHQVLKDISLTVKRGEVVVIDEQFGLRVTEVLGQSPAGDPSAAPAGDGGHDAGAASA